jgi:signal transduction histidine kinase
METFTPDTNTRTVANHDLYADFSAHINSTVDTNSHNSLLPPPARGQLTPGLAHEIRNPLTNINFSVGMLESLIKNDDLKIYLDIIMRSSRRINDLITELLKYQQADEAPVEEHSIHQLLDNVLEIAGDRIILRNITVRKDYDTQDCKIGMNRLRMKIALTNIIINAIDAMTPEKGILELVTKSIYGKYILQIKDNGCGISREDLKHIFRPYFSNKQGGLGLGLSTAYEILQSDHVGIKVESEEGEGTCFTLSFDNLIKHPSL